MPVYTSLLAKGYIAGRTTFTLSYGYVWIDEVDAISAYHAPQFSWPGRTLRVDNIRTVRVDLSRSYFAWMLHFDLTNLSFDGALYEVHWSRMFP